MDRFKPNYYSSLKRKIGDFVCGILIALAAWIGAIYLIGLVGEIMSGYAEGGLMGIYGIVFAPPAIAVISGIALYYKPKRKFIFLGALAAGIVPSCCMGLCLIR